MRRRAEKQAKNRNRPEFDAFDVSNINKRNARFNEKISKNYDEHTAEIQQNLERGVALKYYFFSRSLKRKKRAYEYCTHLFLVYTVI